MCTEAGFGSDIGAEKFFDIKCASAGLDAAVVVLVVTARALKMHGGVTRDALDTPNVAAVAAGIPNMEKHLENIRQFGECAVVAVNRFATDSDEELAVIRSRCEALGIPVAINDHFVRGGEGTLDLADAVVLLLQRRIRRLPVVDEAGRVVGLLSRADVIRSTLAEMKSR